MTMNDEIMDESEMSGLGSESADLVECSDGLHTPSEKMQFNDLNIDCIERIFSFLTVKDKLNFRRVCSAWNAMFKKFWRIADLKVKFKRDKSSAKIEEIDLAYFSELLAIGGHFLKSIMIEIYSVQTDSLRMCIDGDEYIIAGQCSLGGFFKDIANISTKIQYFSCIFSGRHVISVEIPPLSASFSKLFEKNRGLKSFKMHAFQPSGTFFTLKDLPESVEDVGINFFVEDSPAISDWLSVKKNVRSLEFNRINWWKDLNSSKFELSYITAQMMKCATYNHAKNIKVLSLNITSSIPLVKDVKHISAMKCLEDLKISFLMKDAYDNNTDHFLVAISTGCKNLKKFALFGCAISSKGINPILNNLDLTHLTLEYCKPQLNTLPMAHTTLQYLDLNDLQMVDLQSFRMMLQMFKNLKHICITGDKFLNDEDIYKLCETCPRLENVELINNSLLSGLLGFTDKGVHHLLTTLTNLTSVKLASRAISDIIPPHFDNVNSNVQNVTLVEFYYERDKQNILQLKKLSNMRSLSFEFPYNYPTDEEIDAISFDCKKLEEICFILFPELGNLSVEVAEEKMKSCLQAKPSLKSATIVVKAVCTEGSGEKITLKNERGMIVKTSEIYREYYPTRTLI